MDLQVESVIEVSQALVTPKQHVSNTLATHDPPSQIKAQKKLEGEKRCARHGAGGGGGEEKEGGGERDKGGGERDKHLMHVSSSSYDTHVSSSSYGERDKHLMPLRPVTLRPRECKAPDSNRYVGMFLYL